MAKTIASASDDKNVILWDLNGKLKKRIPHKDKVHSISFSYNGKIIASASNDRTVNLWNVNGGMAHQPINLSDKVTSLVFSPNDDNKDIIAFSSGSTIKLENLNGESRELINETSSSSSVLSFSKYGKELAFGDYDSKVNLHLLDGIWRKEFLLYPMSSFSGIPFSPDVQTISVANNEGILLLNNDLDDLLKRACSWASGYLEYNQKVSDGDRKICDDILPSSQKNTNIKNR